MAIPALIAGLALPGMVWENAELYGGINCVIIIEGSDFNFLGYNIPLDFVPLTIAGRTPSDAYVGGTGYAITDQITLTDGTVVSVATVGAGGSVLTAALVSGPTALLANPQTQVSTTGSGIGAEFITLSQYGASQVGAVHVVAFDASGDEIFNAMATPLADLGMNFTETWCSFALSVDTTTQTIQLNLGVQGSILPTACPMYTKWNSSNPIAFTSGTTLRPVSEVLTSGTSWTVPPGVSTVDDIHCWPGGGGAQDAQIGPLAGNGGGGGAYSHATALSVIPGNILPMQIGVGGANGSPSGSDGTPTWFNGSSLISATCSAENGYGATSLGGGNPGTSGIGFVSAGGPGGANSSLSPFFSAGGGGGAGGKDGPGAAGADGFGGQSGGAGGGAADGGSPGGLPSTGTGGNGGASLYAPGGTGAALDSNANGGTGTLGSGGGGGGSASTSFLNAGGGGYGGDGYELAPGILAGAGGGAGGAGSSINTSFFNPGGTGGNFGGGGGGGGQTLALSPGPGGSGGPGAIALGYKVSYTGDNAIRYYNDYRVGVSFNIWEWRFGFDEPFFDLTNPTLLARLFSPTGDQVYWGANGELPTGYRPFDFFRGDAAQWVNNLGTAGYDLLPASGTGTLLDDRAPPT